MKPSERIEQKTQRIARAMFKEEIARGGLVSFAQIAEARGLAILEYLDEQHEVERKRIQLWTALALIGPGCDDALLEPHLKAAGIDCAVDGNTYWKARQLLVAAAEREGLL